MGVLNAMIWQKGLNSSTGKAAALLLGAVALSVVHVADAASLDAPQALDLITATADRICNVVSTKGEAESSEVKGQVKAQLSGLAAKLADVGVSGSGSINNAQYQNVLRQDLASALQSNASCKLKVFDALQAKLLSSATPPQVSTQPQRCNLVGNWICEGRCQRPGGIERTQQDGNTITFINEMSQTSSGYWESNGTVVAINWGDLRGDLTSDCQKIVWRNSTTWIRR
jgi:hypothetical protein